MASQVPTFEEWMEKTNEEKLTKLVKKIKDAETIDIKVLKLLSESRSYEIRRAVAKAKDTPIDMLEKLKYDHVGDVKDAVFFRDLSDELKSLPMFALIDKLSLDDNID